MDLWALKIILIKLRKILYSDAIFNKNITSRDILIFKFDYLNVKVSLCLFKFKQSFKFKEVLHQYNLSFIVKICYEVDFYLNQNYF